METQKKKFAQQDTKTAKPFGGNKRQKADTKISLHIRLQLQLLLSFH